MSDANTEDKLVVLRQELAARRRQCLALAPEDALAHILDAPQPAALVHAFPEEDLHILIREIGPDDALPLIALASSKQLEYLLDQEVWQRDRLDLIATNQWMERLLGAEASPARMTRWLAENKKNLVELFLFRSIEVRMREHDQDPSIFGPDFFSYDNVFYIRIIAPQHMGDTRDPEASGSSPRKTVKRLLNHLANHDYVRFQSILLEAANVLPAESEEEEYRLRTTRLAEKGFLAFEEAVGLYQPLRRKTFLRKALRKQTMVPDHPDHFAMVPLTVMPGGNLFARALESMDAPEQRQTLQEEFAALCNRLIVADQHTINRREDLTAIVSKASGFIQLGLQKCQPDDHPLSADVAGAVRELGRYHLEGLFRLGYGEAIALKREAEEWVHNSWFASRGLSLTFWGETWLGVIGGLLIKRPLFYDNYRSGNMYREFSDRQDIIWSRGQMKQMQAFDQLIGQLNPALAHPATYGYLSYQNLLLTLWARHRLALPVEVHQLSVKAFKPFFRDLFQIETVSTSKDRRSINASRRTDFLNWLADSTSQPVAVLSTTIGPSIAMLFAELEEAYGRIHADNIDPRYMTHFLLESFQR